MKPCTVPRIQPVGDDIARLTDTFESGHRGQSRTRRAGRDDRSVGGLLFADGVEANPAHHTVVVGRKPVAMHLDSGPRAADGATGTPAFRIRPRQWPGPPPDADTREAPPVALHRLRARPRSRPPPTVVPQALVAICELAANANQLPLGRHCARATAARITPGSASRYVGPCADQSSVGSVWKGHALTAL